jgi:hypothetical protein
MSDVIDRQLAEYFVDNQEPILKLRALYKDRRIYRYQQQGSTTSISSNGTIQNQFLFYSELKKPTTEQDIFELMKKNIESRGIKWKNCVSICTNGVPTMLSYKKSYTT